MPARLQGKQKTSSNYFRGEEGTPSVDYNVSKKDLPFLARRLGYTGDPNNLAGMAGYLSGVRNADGSLPGRMADGQLTFNDQIGKDLEALVSRRGRSEFGWNPNYDVNVNFGGLFRDLDPEGHQLRSDYWSERAVRENADKGFSDLMNSYAPLVAIGAPFAVGAATGGLGGLGAVETGAAVAPEYSLAGPGYGSGIGGAPYGLGPEAVVANSGGMSGPLAGASSLTMPLPTQTTFGIPNSILEGLAKGGLGYLASKKQAGAYKDVANQNLAMGAPYRDLLAQSYGKGFDLASQPGYGAAFDRMADIATRQWSPRGNPANTPGIAGGILNDVWNQSYLPALANYRGGLMQAGGMGLNTSGAAQLAGAGATGGQWEAIGAGLQTALGKNPYEEIFKRMNPFPGSQNLGLTVGGVRYG